MKKVIGFLVMVLAFIGCTGGNESATGGAQFMDYVPSILMSIGGIGVAAGLVMAAITKSFDEREKLLITWGGIILIFGAIVYFAS